MRTSIYKDYPVGYSDPNRVLDYGELFIELPEKDSDNIRIKYGDGKTKYKDLPYRLGDTSTDELYFTESDETTINNALSKVVNGTDVRTAISNLKKAIQLTAVSSGVIPDISKEKVSINTDHKYNNLSEVLQALTKTEPLEVTLGNLTQAIQLTIQNTGTGIDVSTSKIIITPDTSATVEEALEKVHSNEKLSVIIGALKNAVSLIESSGVSKAVVNYQESSATTVSEALEQASNGNSLNEIVAGLKKAIKLIQVGGAEALDVTNSEIHPEENTAASKEEALDDADKANKLGDVVAAIKRAVVLSDTISDYGEETAQALAARRRLSAGLNQITNNLMAKVTSTTVTVQPASDNAIDEKVDINSKQVFFNDSTAKTQEAALNEAKSGESLASIVAGLKKAIELMNTRINISNLSVDYIDDESTSVESVAQNARSGQQLKDIVASLKNAVLILNDKIKDQKKISFIEDSNEKTATAYANKIVPGSDISDIVVNLKKAILLLDSKSVQIPDFNQYPLQMHNLKFTSATTAANSINSGSGVADAVTALKQAVLLLDDKKESADSPISDKIVYFDENRATTRDLALKSVLSGKSVSENIAALKRAIELTDATDNISNKSVDFVPDTSNSVDEVLSKIKSGNALNDDISELKRAVELIDTNNKGIDISTKKVQWNLSTTGTTLDALSNIESGRELNIIIPYIKKVLSDATSDIQSIQKRQIQLEKQIEEINKKLQ